MKKLLVITKNFPYNLNEAFLEAESQYLINRFDQVVFLPLYKGVKRETCKSCVTNDSYSLLYSQKILFCVKVLLSKGLICAVVKNIRNVLRRNYLAQIFKQQLHRQIFLTIFKRRQDLFDSNTLVYSYWFNSAVFAVLDIKKHYNLNCKVVCRAHRWDVYDEDGDVPNRDFCLKNIDMVYPISLDAVRFLSKKYGYDEKYCLSRLGVKDYNIISKCSPIGNFHIVSVSQITQRKRIDLILKSIIAFSRRNPDVQVCWSHFGTGEQENDLRHWVETVDCPNLVIEIKGKKPNIEIMKYLSETYIDVFVNLSSSEGVPVSIMEAQSFGIPVLATNVGGTGEIISKDNGILLSSNPSINEVVQGFELINENNYDRNVIKSQWKKMSNAETNFLSFANHLWNLL